MATTTPTGSPVPTLGDAPNVPADMLRLAVFLDPVTIPRFTTTSNANIAFPTPYVGQEINVAGNHYQYYEAGWRIQPQLKWGKITNTLIEGNGYARIPSALCFFEGVAPTWWLFTPVYFKDVVTLAVIDGAGILCNVYNTDLKTTPAPGNPVSFNWLVAK